MRPCAIVCSFSGRGDSGGAIALYGFGMLRIRAFSFDPIGRAGVIERMRCFRVGFGI